MSTLTDKLATAPKMEMSKVESYGFEQAGVQNYADFCKKVASEWVVVYDGRKRRVYSWVPYTGTDAMYVIVDGVEHFVTPEIEAMLYYGQAEYGVLKPVASSLALV